MVRKIEVMYTAIPYRVEQVLKFLIFNIIFYSPFQDTVRSSRRPITLSPPLTTPIPVAQPVQPVAPVRAPVAPARAPVTPVQAPAPVPARAPATPARAPATPAPAPAAPVFQAVPAVPTAPAAPVRPSPPPQAPKQEIVFAQQPQEIADVPLAEVPSELPNSLPAFPAVPGQPFDPFV